MRDGREEEEEEEGDDEKERDVDEREDLERERDRDRSSKAFEIVPGRRTGGRRKRSDKALSSIWFSLLDFGSLFKRLFPSFRYIGLTRFVGSVTRSDGPQWSSEKMVRTVLTRPFP